MISLEKTEDEIRTAAKDLGVEVDSTMGKGKLIDEIFGEKCEGELHTTDVYHRLSKRNESFV